MVSTSRSPRENTTIPASASARKTKALRRLFIVELSPLRQFLHHKLATEACRKCDAPGRQEAVSSEIDLALSSHRQAAKEVATMLRLTERRRTIVAEKFADLANLAVAALVFGQALGDEPFSVGVGLVGAAVWSVFMGVTFYLAGDSR